jgi:hypothetical protein
MHRVVIGAPDGVKVDHINGDGLDNQRHNIRKCTQSENSRNRRLSVNNKSGFKGVTWVPKRKKYEVNIGVKGKRKFLGYFSSAEEGARVYDNAAKKYHGKFAHLNFSVKAEQS